MWIKTKTAYINTNNVSRLYYMENRGTWVESGNNYSCVSKYDVTAEIMKNIILGEIYMEVE